MSLLSMPERLEFKPEPCTCLLLTSIVIIILLFRSRAVAKSREAQEKAYFLKRCPDYGYGGRLESWRSRQFPGLIAPKSSRDRLIFKQRRGGGEREVFLDYAGCALPTRNLLKRQDVTQILANPHSSGGGKASARTVTMMNKSRDLVMSHFGIRNELLGVKELDMSEESRSNFDLVWTSGTTDSLRLVAERFPWCKVHITAKSGATVYRQLSSNDWYSIQSIHTQSLLIYATNVHTSVLGMREIALKNGCGFQCCTPAALLNASVSWFESLINKRTANTGGRLSLHACENIEGKKNFSIEETTETIWIHHLIVLPLECNFTGDRFDWTETMKHARSSSYDAGLVGVESDSRRTLVLRHKFHVLLDTAKAASTSRVDIPSLSPDFAVVSFYKLLGSPTGVGALFVRKRNNNQPSDATDEEPFQKDGVAFQVDVDRKVSSRQYFGGSSVDVVLADEDYAIPRGLQETRAGENCETVHLGVMEHGTQNFRGIINLIPGLEELDRLPYGGMSSISRHANCLAAELASRLMALKHDNAKPVVQIYGSWCKPFASKVSSGPTVAFNIVDREGLPIGHDEVVRLAIMNRPPIQVRNGCFCNPGACQLACSLTNEQVKDNYSSGHVCGDRRGIVNGRPTGAVRASFGRDSIWEDADALVEFIKKMFVTYEGDCSSPPRPSDPDRSNSLEVLDIFVFPIKSCSGSRLKRWPIDRTGRLSLDREFALVGANGMSLRLHSYPSMSSVRPVVDLDELTMTVSFPGMSDLVIDLKHDSNFEESDEDILVCGERCRGRVWGGSKASAWFSSALGVRCWLARQSDVGLKGDLHETKYGYCNDEALLLVSQESIDKLNDVIIEQRWGRPVSAEHFRPNLVVSSDTARTGSNPEDAWQAVTVFGGGRRKFVLEAVGKCARCHMVDVDPRSGQRGNTLRALAHYRRGGGGAINFGTFFRRVNDAEDIMSAWVEKGDKIVPVL